MDEILKVTINPELNLVAARMVKNITEEEQERINKVVEHIIKKTNDINDVFLWNVYEAELLTTCFYYLAEMTPMNTQTLFHAKQLLDFIELDKNNNEKDIFDIMFEALADENPESMAVKKYLIFKAMPSHCIRVVVEGSKSRLETYVNFNYL